MRDLKFADLSLKVTQSEHVAEASPLLVQDFSSCVPSVLSSCGFCSGEFSPASLIQVPLNSDFPLSSQFKTDPYLTLGRYCSYVAEGTRAFKPHGGRNHKRRTPLRDLGEAGVPLKHPSFIL